MGDIFDTISEEPKDIFDTVAVEERPEQDPIDPDQAYADGVKIQDMSVEQGIPIEDIESIWPEVQDWQAGGRLFDPSEPPQAKKEEFDIDVRPRSSMMFTTPAERTTGQKIKEFFTGTDEQRSTLPPNATRQEKFSHILDRVFSLPLWATYKAMKGLSLGSTDIAWAAMKRALPEDMQEELKDQTLDQFILEGLDYDPPGFSAMVGGITDFVGGIVTAGKLIPKAASKYKSIFDKALETGERWALARIGKELSKFGAEKINPEADYNYDGAKGVIVDFGIGFGFSLAGSAGGRIAKWAGETDTGKAISEGAHKAVIAVSKKFPQTTDMIRPNPDQYFLNKTMEFVGNKTGKSWIELTPKEQAVAQHVARESQRLWQKAYKNWLKKPDVVLAKAKPVTPEAPKVPAQLMTTEDALAKAFEPPEAPTGPPAAAPVAKPPAKAAITPAKAPEAIKGIIETSKARWGSIKQSYEDAERAEKALPGVPFKDIVMIAVKQGKRGVEDTRKTLERKYVRRDDSNKASKELADKYKDLDDIEIGLGFPRPYQPRKGEPSYKQWRKDHEGPDFEAMAETEIAKRAISEEKRIQKETKEFAEKHPLLAPTPKAEAVKTVPERVAPKGKPGKLNVEPLQKSFDAVLDILEPAKRTDIKLGKDVSATVIRGIHKPDVARIEFNEKEIESLDSTLQEFGQKLGKYSNDILETLMLSRGKPATKEAIAIRDEALAKLAKEAPELVGVRKMINRIADFNYKFLTDVVGDKVGYVEDYFFGIYKDPKKVERFIDFWRTTKKFTKEKKLPTVADAKAYGLELRDPNPVNNLRSEFMAISRLDGMIWMRDELLRTGEGKFISKDPGDIKDAEKIPEPVFKGLWFDPVLAQEIKKLISANKIAKIPVLNALRKTNNFLRSIKFIFSGFHHLVIAKQAVADSGYLGWIYKPTALRGLTLGFRKSDPRFKTEEYKKYIEHGGGHRFSIDSEAERAFVRAMDKLTKPLIEVAGKAGPGIKAAAQVAIAPVTIPKGYVKWLFENYIPEVKYTKYLDTVNEKQKRLKRELGPAEHVEVIKEGQNFYGMMNERLFGRSGTVTTVLRLKFMAPGFAEGNYRTMLKAISQWGQEGTWNAGRSRANIVNSLILTGIAATVGTLAFTGKPPKKPETSKDYRDLFKIDTGKVDAKGRRIMIDMMTYDKDYWAVFGKPLVGQGGEVPAEVIRRLGGMTATTFEVISDLNDMSMGKAIYDWKGDRVVEVTDPFLKRAAGLVAFEMQKVEPISTNIYRQSRDRGLTRMAAAITTLAGARPTTSEKDRRESQIISRIFSLRDRQERLYHFLGSIKNPRKHINEYNKIAQSVLDNPITTQDMKQKWGKNLIIDTERLISNKVHTLELEKVTDKPEADKITRDKKWLKNFDVPDNQFRHQLAVYEMKHRKIILEMKAGDADDMLKTEIARFYADKGILNRKVKGNTADDKEKRLSRRFDKIAGGISTIATRLHKTDKTSDRKRMYDRIKSLIERSTE
jgi:hypothetical protein